MKKDPGSNYEMKEVYAAASVAASTVYTDAVDHINGESAAFVISCGTYATSFAITLQHSVDNSTWVDEADALAGNDKSGSITAAGDLVIKVPNPRSRYSRLKMVLGGTCVFAVVAVVGPYLNKQPAATT